MRKSYRIFKFFCRKIIFPTWYLFLKVNISPEMWDTLTKGGYILFYILNYQWSIIWHILIFRYMQLRRLQKCHLDISIRHTVNDHLRNIGEYWPLLVSSYIKWCHNRKIWKAILQIYENNNGVDKIDAQMMSTDIFAFFVTIYL